MRTPAAAARRPSPMRRRDKSPVKTSKTSGESAFPYESPAPRARPQGESAYPYEQPSSRARLSVESAYPYEHPSSSRARPSWMTAPQGDEGFEEEDELEVGDLEVNDEEDDLYGLEPSYTARPPRPARVDRLSEEPEGGIELDDNLDDVDLDALSAFAYAMTRRAGARRNASIPSFSEVGPAGREALSRLAERKGKATYEGMPLGSISESIATAMPRSIPVAFARAPTPTPIGEMIEADDPWSDTYELFYLTPLPPLSTTSYDELPPPPTQKRGTNHYINRPTIIPPHTAAIITAELATTSPTTTTTTAPTTTTATTTSTRPSSTLTTAIAPSTQPAPAPPLDLDDEGFSEPTTLESTEALERSLLACLSRGCGRAAGRRVRGSGETGETTDGGGGPVVRPRVRKRISKRKGGRRDP